MSDYFVDGVRPYTAVRGNVVTAKNEIDFFDQMREAIGMSWKSLLPGGLPYTYGNWEMAYGGAGYGWYWVNTIANNAILRVPIALDRYNVLHSVLVRVGGHSSSTGGALTLYLLDPVKGYTGISFGTSPIFATGGTTYTTGVTYTLDATSNPDTFPYTIDDNTCMVLYVGSSANSDTYPAFIWDMRCTYQLGIGSYG